MISRALASVARSVGPRLAPSTASVRAAGAAAGAARLSAAARSLSSAGARPAGLAGLLALTAPRPAFAASATVGGEAAAAPERTPKTILQGVALSAVLGYAAALGVQWVGKSVATLLVAAAALLQFLHHKRVVRVSWSGIGKRFAWLLDFDRDGKLGVGDVKVAARKAGGVLGVTRVPSGAAFVVGLAFGLGVLPPKF